MRILLTNAHRNAGFCITRHLGAAGHHVIAADSRPLAFGLRSRYARSFELLPDPDAPDYADSLLAAIRRTRPEVLLPFGGVAAISARREEFERETAVLVAEANAHQALLDKGSVYGLCQQFGIPHPRVLGTDPEAVCTELREPGDGSPIAVLKPRRDQGAGRGLVFIQDKRQIGDLWPGLVARYGAMVATAFLPGPVDAQNAVHLLFDRNSELIEFFVVRKLRQWPPRSGITVAATSTHEIELVGQMLPLFRHLRWRGPAEVEFKRDPQSGAACVLEINPRFSGMLAFPLAAGVDLVSSMLSATLGRPNPRALRPHYPQGLYYWNPWPYARSVLSDLARARDFRHGLHGLAFPFARRPSGNPYHLDDPAALVGKLLLEFTEAWSRRPAPPGAGEL
jgi:biotin carboxylase